MIFDSVNGNVFKVIGGKQRVIEFKQSSKELYYWNNEKHRTEELVLVNIVKENDRRYTKREVKEAMKEQRLNELIDYPSRVDMETMLSDNLIKDCSVTHSDCRRAVDVYGANFGSVREKTIRVRPGHVRTDVINPLPNSILDLHISVTLCADIFYVNGDMYLGTVSRKIKFVTASYVDNRKYNVLLPVLIKVITLYCYRGFKVEFILTDDEFLGMSVKRWERGALLNGSSTNDYVPETERMSRTIKERYRVKVNTLSFNINKYSKLTRI